MRRGPYELRHKADWVIKMCLIEKSTGVDPLDGIEGVDSDILEEMQRIHIGWHLITSTEGSEGYGRQLRRRGWGMPTDYDGHAAIAQRVTTPPQDTRAKRRGDAIALGNQKNVNWDTWYENGKKVIVKDAYDGNYPVIPAKSE